MGERPIASGRGSRAAPRLCRHLQFSAPRCPADASGPAARQWPRHPPLPGGSDHRGDDARRHSRDGHQPELPGVNAAGTRLYSANETDRVGEKKEGTVSAFAINRADGKLKLLNTVGSGGAGPTYLSIHPSGRFVLVANYFGGSVAVLPILADGRLGDATDVKNDAGKLGPTQAKNAPPGSFAISGHDRTHAHMIQADPSGRFVLHVDLGLDRIFVWKFDEQKGMLTPADRPAVSLPPGDGPRHFAFHPNGRWIYSIQEEGSTVVLFDYDAATGRLDAAADDLHAAAWFRRHQLLLGDPGLDRRPVPLRRQPACTTASRSSPSAPTAL